MKRLIFLSSLLLAGISLAADPAPTADVKLPYGVADVVKLSRAQVNEGVILSYVQNSGTVYNLEAKDVVYLREQGVSDAVVTAMLNQRREMSQYASQPAPAPQPQQPVNQPTYAPTVPQVAQEPEAYAPASSAYVIPYPTSYYPAYYSSYSYWPYYSSYYPYYGYCGPSLSFRFGYGGRGYSHYGGYGRYGGYGHFGGFGTHVGGFSGHFSGGGHSGGGGHFGGSGHFGGGMHASGGGGHHR
jgi:hypothetical protein